MERLSQKTREVKCFFRKKGRFKNDKGGFALHIAANRQRDYNGIIFDKEAVLCRKE